MKTGAHEGQEFMGAALATVLITRSVLYRFKDLCAGFGTWRSEFGWNATGRQGTDPADRTLDWPQAKNAIQLLE